MIQKLSAAGVVTALTYECGQRGRKRSQGAHHEQARADNLEGQAEDRDHRRRSRRHTCRGRHCRVPRDPIIGPRRDTHAERRHFVGIAGVGRSGHTEQPVGGRDQSADGSRIRTGGGVRARRW